jgi:26S proteasome regulatory subunit N11
MEVMGLMLGDVVDDYTVKVADVFAMPQSGTGVSVEAVDPVFQKNMTDMLSMTHRFGTRPSSSRLLLQALPPSFLFTFPAYRTEPVVGWYHSHPGFGCWLSGVDVNTQQVLLLSFFLLLLSFLDHISPSFPPVF